jgi:hypothetical protein
MKHVLPIKSSYVHRWGIWECLRELIQNAKDEEEENGNVMNVTHKAGWLHIDNEGADLSVQALLIGQTSKVGKRELRGEHGEGLDLAFLAGVRDDYDIRVETRDEVWTPKLEYVKNFGANCLVVQTRRLRKSRAGVRVSVRIDRKTWLEYRRRFLFLDEPTNKAVTESGTMLMDEDRKGEIYVKGIYVMKTHGETFGYGFDLRDAKLDRDRQMINSFDLNWALARIIRDALNKEPEQYVSSVMNMLDGGSDEVEYLGSHIEQGSDASQALAEAFKAKHGDNAIPVNSMAESQQLDHLGAKGIVVNRATAKVLAPELGDYETATSKLRTNPTNRYGWHDLTEAEQANLTRAQEAIKAITDGHMDTMTGLQVVDFADDSIEGSCVLATGEIKVARAKCGDYYDLLGIIVHELSHAVSQAGDGTVSHVRTIEAMWQTLYKVACEVPS